jgi:hypothetical protein
MGPKEVGYHLLDKKICRTPGNGLSCAAGAAAIPV